VALAKPQSQEQLDLQPLTQPLDLQRLSINSQVLERSLLEQLALLKFLLLAAVVVLLVRLAAAALAVCYQ
jgi:hypothetical protein